MHNLPKIARKHLGPKNLLIRAWSALSQKELQYRRWNVSLHMRKCYCVFCKCFISSNCLITGAVKIVVITVQQIFIFYFFFSGKEYFHHWLEMLSTPAFKIFSLLFCWVVEIFSLWCGNALYLVCKLIFSVVEIFRSYCRKWMETKNSTL